VQGELLAAHRRAAGEHARRITGSISSYHGLLQLEPTAQTILQVNAAAPPTYTASSGELAESATSAYQGVHANFRRLRPSTT
jgi:hypothetical protein